MYKNQSLYCNPGKKVNLVDYMKARHLNAIKLEGDTARLRSHHSVVLVSDGYFENPSKVHHDAIEFLMKYEHMLFQDAVRELCLYYDGAMSADLEKRSADSHLTAEMEHKSFELPPASSEDADYEQVRQYLQHRGIELIPELEQMIYPTRHNDHVNIVFQSVDCDYAEIRGAFDPAPPMRPFKSKAKHSDHDGYFIVGDITSPDTIFVCESAIDAISLMMLFAGGEPHCAYASIGGAGCIGAIQRISHTYSGARIIIAFDNDEAGHKAADMLPYEKQYPVYKDWNEDLVVHGDK